MQDAVSWAAPGAPGFLWRDFGAMSVLFDPRSGETHLLDPLSREILDLLIEQPRSGTALTEAVTVLLGAEQPDQDRDIGARVQEAIGEFDRLGLIFPQS